MAKLKLSDKIERELKRTREDGTSLYEGRSFWVTHRVDKEQEHPPKAA